MTKDAPKGRTEGGRFAAGNPGRPPGARHKTTVAVEKLLDTDARAITKKAIAMAKGGDTTALRLCLERIAPPRRGRTVQVTGMPAVTTASDVPAAITVIIAAVAAGELTTDEANDLTGVLDKFVKAIEITDLEQRLKDIEGRLSHGA